MADRFPGERLVVRDLEVDYLTAEGMRRAVDGANLRLEANESVGLVGESGSGKTTLGLALGGLLPANAKVFGDIRVVGRSVVGSSVAAVRSLRRDFLGFIFQSPMAALDPTRKIGRLLADLGVSRDGMVDLLERVALPSGEQILKSYPHQLSGGMAQRVAVAMAIARHPKLVVADEPTASLDSSVRKHILDLIFGLRGSIGASVLFLSHDLHSVGRYCDRVAVMYGGRIVEEGLTAQVLEHPAHPYTAALLGAMPGTEGHGGRLEPIPGSPPRLTGRSQSCAFLPRCQHAIETCGRRRPEPARLSHQEVICFRADELSLSGQRGA